MRQTPMVLALLLAGTAGAAVADTTAEAEERSWKASAEFGLAVASGNADSETVNGRFEFLREEDRWFYGLNAAALRAKADNQLSANRFDVGLKLGYDFSERTYGFGSLRYENDDFASYEYQVVAAAGVGYRFIDSERTTLVGELGPGVRRWQPIDALQGTPPVIVAFAEQTDSIIRGSLDLQHQLTPTASIGNRLLAESGGGSTFIQNDLGLTVKMSERFALKAGYQVRHTTDVPPDIEKTDTLFTTNLVLGF